MDQYPINEYGPIMPGMIMAGVAIVHVFLAQFAVGGGILLCYFQWLSLRGKVPATRDFVHGYFKVLVLVSFVLGALTGVGIWFTAIQVSAATIREMVLHFHWVWGIEWTFFCLEVVSGYCFYRYHHRLTDRESLRLLVIYSLAAWGSLFWINGILSWQLTPGDWLKTKFVWDGFFNESFWPSLLFRTTVSMCLASLAACVVINLMPGTSRDQRAELIQHAARLLIPMAVMPVLGVWYLMVLPEDSRGWILGGSPAMTLFMNGAVAASMAVGGYALVGLVYQKQYINGATATLLLFLAFGATAGGEFVREGARKPFSIRGWMYSNGVRIDGVGRLRIRGVKNEAHYPPRGGESMPDNWVFRGAVTYRELCSVCHTLNGVNGVCELTGGWDLVQMRQNLSKLQQTKPFMPPFASSAEDLEGLVQYIAWTSAGKPDRWVSDTTLEDLQQIQQWLNEAGTEPGRPRTLNSRNEVRP